MIEKTIQYKNMTIFYYVEGDSTQDTMVMLHPAFADHTIFGKQFAQWKDQYHMIAIDMVAHGKSQPGKAKVHMGNMPEIILHIMNAEQVDKAHIIGVSLGSLVAQGFANQYPERIHTVAVVGGYSIHKNTKQIMKEQQKEMGKWILYLLFAFDKFKTYIVETSSYSQASKEVFEQCLKTFTRKQFMSMRGMNQIICPKEEAVNYPLLMVCGEHDNPILLAFCEKWVLLEPKSQYVVIAKAGHCANIDNSMEFDKVYLRFIDGKK